MKGENFKSFLFCSIKLPTILMPSLNIKLIIDNQNFKFLLKRGNLRRDFRTACSSKKTRRKRKMRFKALSKHLTVVQRWTPYKNHEVDSASVPRSRWTCKRSCRALKVPSRTWAAIIGNDGIAGDATIRTRAKARVACT